MARKLPFTGFLDGAYGMDPLMGGKSILGQTIGELGQSILPRGAREFLFDKFDPMSKLRAAPIGEGGEILSDPAEGLVREIDKTSTKLSEGLQKLSLEELINEFKNNEAEALDKLTDAQKEYIKELRKAGVQYKDIFRETVKEGEVAAEKIGTAEAEIETKEAARAETESAELKNLREAVRTENSNAESLRVRAESETANVESIQQKNKAAIDARTAARNDVSRLEKEIKTRESGSRDIKTVQDLAIADIEAELKKLERSFEKIAKQAAPGYKMAPQEHIDAINRRGYSAGLEVDPRDVLQKRLNEALKEQRYHELKAQGKSSMDTGAAIRNEGLGKLTTEDMKTYDGRVFESYDRLGPAERKWRWRRGWLTPRHNWKNLTHWKPKSQD